MAANETASGPSSVAVTATATGEGSIGVLAKGDAVGVRGDGKTWHGVVGFSEGGFGVYGEGLTGGSGVVGKSKGWHAVGGFSESTTGGAGLYGEATGPGVIGMSTTWHGVYGETPSTTAARGCGVNTRVVATALSVSVKPERAYMGRADAWLASSKATSR